MRRWILIAVMMGLLPQTASSAPATSPQQVKVVNTPAEPIPAAQSGSWSVSVGSMPQVSLAPDSTLPSHLGRKPSELIQLRPAGGNNGGFAYNASNSESLDRSVFYVPQGKVLVITDFSAVLQMQQFTNTTFRFDLVDDWLVDQNAYTGTARYSLLVPTDASGYGSASVHFTAGIVIPAGHFVTLYYPFNSNIDLTALGYLADAQ